MGLLSITAAATLVFCAPGYPGGASDAQPLLDQFTQALVAGAHWPAGSLDAIYDPTDAGGLTRLEAPDAVLAFVPYPFYFEHASRLQLRPMAQAELLDVGSTQRWSLVAKAGALSAPASLSGYTLVSVAGYAPQFVRRIALRDYALPAEVKIESTGQVLSALRKIANGERLVALLDQEQASALATLPFAAQLQTLTRSAPLPVALMALVDSRLPASKVASLQHALLAMGSAAPESALAPLKLKGFQAPQLPPDTPPP